MSELTNYAGLLAEIKDRIQAAQTRAVLAVNAELIRLYWQIGALLDARQASEGWGAAVIPRLARDIRNELPEQKGFSERNLKRMLAFFREYRDLPWPRVELVPPPVAPAAPDAGPTEKVPQPVAQTDAALLAAIPWGHHLTPHGARQPKKSSQRSAFSIWLCISRVCDHPVHHLSGGRLRLQDGS